MADRPILFSGPMVCALLAGTKTQTRRTMKVKPNLSLGEVIADGLHSHGMIHVSRQQLQEPRIAIGDRLHVREAWRVPAQEDRVRPRDLERQIIGYEADCGPGQISATGKFRQAMHMPRWASRLTLTVTDIQVERLQDISEADALAEGIEVTDFVQPTNLFGVRVEDGEWCVGPTARAAYSVLWTRINDKPGVLVGESSWDRNPWVAAYTFTVERGNIDALAEGR